MCNTCKHNSKWICTLYGHPIEYEYRCEDHEEVNDETDM